MLGIPIAYRFGNTIAAALTLNLSRGGIAIRTTSPLENGANVRLRFRLPGSKSDIDAEGRVAWSDRRHGMGLQFEKVEPPDQTAIDEFVDAHFFSSRKVTCTPTAPATCYQLPPTAYQLESLRRSRRWTTPSSTSASACSRCWRWFWQTGFSWPPSSRSSRCARRASINCLPKAAAWRARCGARSNNPDQFIAGDAARHHDGQPGARLDRRARARVAARAAAASAARADFRRHRAHRRRRHRVCRSSPRCTSCSASSRRRPWRCSIPSRPRSSSPSRQSFFCACSARSSAC